MTATLARLGRGWAFPIAPDAVAGDLRYREGPEKVREAIRIVLMTEPGERVMRPTFGCPLRSFLMSPNNVATRALIEREVEAALSAWEQRIRVREVVAEAGDDPALVLVSVRYEHRRDASEDLLVWPFYLDGRPS